MFESQNQIYYFAECVFIGVICGFLYELFRAAEIISGKKSLAVAGDIFFCAAAFLIYFVSSAFFAFPFFRAYMPIGAISGFLLCRITWLKTLAKFTDNWYNKIRFYVRRKIYDRIKNAPRRFSRFGNGGYSVRNFGSSVSVATRGPRRKKVSSGKVEGGNRYARTAKARNRR
ncbi:MAG: spore cortex biosynthesis protein YabQ [Clostridia bacterium]|nr:spore cortex biosynthesis protein YabQ [Clostridia bacterium]